MKSYLEEFKNELTDFYNKTEQFYNKEISVKEYKSFSGKYGSYAQRGGNASMIRLRMTGGILTIPKFKYIVDTIKKYNINKIHFTTCETIQLHNLNKNDLCEIMNSAFDNGIITIGGGGDYPRNVMCSPLSGVELNENFDVMPYAEKSASYLLSFVNSVKLPRKLKVCFSNSPKNKTHATFRDLGFVSNKDKTFDVYSAGGLGNNPKMGVCVAKKISPEDVLYYIKAMIIIFTKYGNYESRAKARTRYMQDTLGVEKYIDEYNKILEKIKSEEDLKIDVSPKEISKRGVPKDIESDMVIKQKQEGLYAFRYHPIGGTPTIENFINLYDTIKDFKDVEVRISPEEELYIINCTAEEIEKISNTITDNAENIFETSVACIGNSICQVGLRDSQALVKKLSEETRKHNFKSRILPQIHISGCPSSCGTHQIGIIGFHGTAKVVDKVPQPAFFLHIKGNERRHEERFGKILGVILEKDIPDFIVELGKTVEKEGSTFENWLENNEDNFNKIAEKYIQK